MASSLPRIRARIRSIRSTGKLTKAMELIAGARSRRLERELRGEEEAVELYRKALVLLKEKVGEEEETERQGGRLLLVAGPSLGLSGGYPSKAMEALRKEGAGATVIAFGTRLPPRIKEEGLSHLETPLEADPMDGEGAAIIAETLLSWFMEGKYSSIDFLYGNPVNSLIFNFKTARLLPLSDLGDEGLSWAKERPPLMDEDPKALLDALLPAYLASMVHYLARLSSLAENISRRRAMEEANDNVDELLDGLTLTYNKERQNAITQEITEVISGSME